MTPVVFTQLVFILWIVFKIKTSAAAHSGFILLSCPDIRSPKSTAPCLVQGKTTTRRDDYINSMMLSQFKHISVLMISIQIGLLSHINCRHTPGVGTHRIHPGLATWNSARRICEEQGSHLVILNSVAEAKAIGQLLTKSGRSYAWTGVHDLYQEDEFVTIHGQPLAQTGYNGWEKRQPDNGHGNEHCVIVHPDGQMSDIPCDHRHSIICEIP